MAGKDQNTGPASGRDTPGRKSIEEELRESRRRLHTLMSNLPGMAYRCLNDPNWTMLFVSEGCEKLCGYSADELQQGSVIWNDLLVPEDRQWLWDQVQRAVADREPFEVEYRIRHADGSIRWMWEQGRGVFRDGELEALEGFITDITARKRAEQELRQADRRKDQFLAMLGHELRNPLTAILSSAELLEDTRPDSEELDKIRGLLSRQAKQMKTLVDGLLDISRITRGKISLDKQKIDLLAVLRELMDDRGEQLAKRRVEVRVAEAPMWVEADPVRLSQIFDNLLANAIKFTKPSDTISISAQRLDDGRAEVVVSDSGAGIDPKYLGTIFEPFQQATQGDLEQSGGGLGMGLALAKSLVELHNGEIEARSEGPGQGAAFTVRIPLIEAPAMQTSTSEPSESTGRYQILVVEDDRDIADVLILLFSRLGHDVTVASTAPEGLEVAREKRPDMIVCDLGLPGMSGYEFAQRSRADERLADLPLVALTGYGGGKVRQRALEAGFDEHVTKPVSMDELDELCERCCGH